MLAACVATAVCALLAPAAADAVQLKVNSTADEADSALGSGGCATATAKCTLRAAIEESNFSTGVVDEIRFTEEPFDGAASSTITLASALPALTDRVRINGGECTTAAGVGGPCAGIEANGAATGLVASATTVDIKGLAITGADTGIEVKGVPAVKVRGDWLGVRLDGGIAGNGVGVLLAPGSTEARIGGEGAEMTNLFAGSDEYGVRVYGASATAILGNRFGVGADGTTAAVNQVDVEVASKAGGPLAEGTSIGTRVAAPNDSTAACDGGCNLIAGAGVGIELAGAGAEEAPPVATTIRGNQLGLDATGAPLPNTDGIHVGAAPQTVIGGPWPGDANRLNGGDTAIGAGPAAPDLVVRGNAIGLDAAGGMILAPPAAGIAVDSSGLTSPALEATIVGNRMGLGGGPGIVQSGFGATIAGNVVRGAGTGILASGPEEGHGNQIEGNLVEGSAADGILVEDQFNQILGNEVVGSGGAGIAIRGALPFGVSGNLIGGDSAASENVVSLNAGAAIEITDAEKSDNEVARNRGFGNLGSFVDLRAVGPEPAGPNKGILPPAIATATQGGAGGTGAEPGALVRVFRKQGDGAGEIESFLGEAIVDSGGAWQLVYAAAIPGGTPIAATQTSEAGGTSELATATTAAAAGGGQGSPPQDQALDVTPPQTRLLRGPARESTRTGASFRFAAGEPGAGFQCRLDHGRFHACGSPLRLRHLKPGRHRFEVRAVDAAGNVDPTPARLVFTVLARRR